MKIVQRILIVAVIAATVFFLYEGVQYYRGYKEFQNTASVSDDNQFQDLKLIDGNLEQWPDDSLFLTKGRQAYQSKDLRLIVPRIKCDEYVMDGTTMEMLSQGPGLYECSQLPGEGNRNVSIAAHRAGVSHYANLFKHIDKIGDEDLMYLTDEKKVFVYEYKETEIVEPEDISVLYLKGYSCLTLTSCHPLGHNYQRIVVRGKLVKILPYSDTMEFPKTKKEAAFL